MESTYIDIINENISTIKTLYPDGFLLQQDNARPHTSRQTTKSLDDNGISILKYTIFVNMKNKVEKERNNTVKEWKEDSIKMWDETILTLSSLAWNLCQDGFKLVLP